MILSVKLKWKASLLSPPLNCQICDGHSFSEIRTETPGYEHFPLPLITKSVLCGCECSGCQDKNFYELQYKFWSRNNYTSPNTSKYSIFNYYLRLCFELTADSFSDITFGISAILRGDHLPFQQQQWEQQGQVLYLYELP